MANLSGLILKIFGWSVNITIPDYPKLIVCVAPHTSNWDFILGKLAYASINRKAGFLMKDTWFFWPLGSFFRAIGGIPVPRKRKSVRSLTEVVVEKLNESAKLTIAITPEGTRSKTSNWRTGFLHIAQNANVPIALGVLDYPTHQIIIEDIFEPTGDTDADMRTVKDFYKPYQGKYPDKFSTE